MFTLCLWREGEKLPCNPPGPKLGDANLVLVDEKNWSGVVGFFCRGNMNFCVFRIDSSHDAVLGNSFHNVPLAAEYQPRPGCRTGSLKEFLLIPLAFRLSDC